MNAALMLEQAVSTSPGLSSGDRAAALALAGAYKNLAAVASLNDLSIWRPSPDDGRRRY